MRIDVQFRDRVGIAQEILALLAGRQFNVTAVEVTPPNIFIDAPALTESLWRDLRAALMGVEGVIDAFGVDIMPGARQRLHLDALMAAMADPVLLVDLDGVVLAGNAAAAHAAGLPNCSGLALSTLFADAILHQELVESGFRSPPREVFLSGRPFQLDASPVAEDSGAAAGGLLTLYAPVRLGERMHGLQQFPGFDGIIGGSQAVRDLKKRAIRVAAVDAPLLILGETGTGKELVAHACHQASPRKAAPFLALNCAAVPENLAESELFGYAPGAFSGAQRGGKPGLLEMADKGTVFLDEIGEMSPYLQAKLLRFLNDGTFRRVGGDREVKVDVRIVSATHRDLQRMVADRAFREDLYYRLNVLQLSLPPLRERGEDILLLAGHFVARASSQGRRSQPVLTAAAQEALRSHHWPGNVRQLENVIFRAVTMSDRPVLDAGDLDLGQGGAEVPFSDARADGLPQSWDQAVEEWERRTLSKLYPLYPSSRKLAGRLGTSHTRIANKLRRYGIGDA
ncbi:MAG TPA: sigma 54-interacting transcriptional regulator [Candidatus Sulfotelmatobacter sp.]|jgi:TyrR family helix-turn-helix protein|nr:sigma 54-interacting transcriptional regulator [Candidatus Sulfotelmatobacter sp.]